MKTVLSIDDDLIVRKSVIKALKDEYNVIVAENGEQGIAKAIGKLPDIVLLDVEMPDKNGYEVCEYLKGHEKTKDIPVVFISSRGDLGERMRGYEVGATDYLVKPFQSHDLLAKLRVLGQLSEQQSKLKEEVSEARKTAHVAMSGSSELGLVMQFVERSYEMDDYEELAKGVFKVLNSFGLNTALQIKTPMGDRVFSSSGSVSPLETELMGLLKERSRFQDFGCRTQVNYPNISILIKNMPLDDPERYGRYKDIIPAMQSAADAKIRTINTMVSIREQTQEVNQAFEMIRSNLLGVSNRMQVNQGESHRILQGMLDELAQNLPRMGLEDDQESYILSTIDNAIKNSFDLTDDNALVQNTMREVSGELQVLLDKQNQIMQQVLENRKRPDSDDDDLMAVELF